MDSVNPKLILLFSGKRKSGKDFLADLLVTRLDENVAVIIRISGPIKSHWAKKENINLEELMSDGKLKEEYRLQMVEWSERIRNNDHGIFCKEAIDMFDALEKPIWIVSDVRRKTDIKWFKDTYGTVVKTVRIISSDDVRRDRGWTFKQGIDDAETECDLDDYADWDWTVQNDGDEDSIQNFIQTLITVAADSLTS